MVRFFLSAIVASLLILTTGQLFAVDALSESIRVDWEPAGTLSVRAVARIRERLELAVAGRSGDENQRIRLGLGTPVVVVGPLAVSGAYRELFGSGAGPWSDAWYAPGRIDLDSSLDSSRRGLVLRPLSALDLFVLEASTLVVGTRLALGNRDFFAEVLVAHTSVASIRDGEQNVTPSWFEDPAPALPIGNLIVRAAGTAGWVTVGSSMSVSLPRSALPGLALRGATKLSLPGRWKLGGIGFLATSDYRLAGGERPGDPARWGAALRRKGRFVDVGFDFARAYASPEAAYDAIGFATESLVGSNGEATASIAIRRRDESRRLASVGSRVEFEFPTGGTTSWSARFTSRIAPQGRRIELSPSVAVASESRVSARVRTVYSISALAFVLVGEYEWDPDESDFDFSFSIRYRV